MTKDCRESRPVPFYADGDVWRGVKEGLVTSVDLDADKRFNAELKIVPPASPEARTVFSLQTPPKLPPASLMEDRVSRLESDNRMLRAHVNVLGKVIETLVMQIHKEPSA